MRLIDADALLEQIDTEREILVQDDRLGAEHILVHYVREFIEDAPTIDRPQGEWIDRSDGGRILYPWWESCECNQCKEWGSGAWNFCPHCGARM